MIHDKTMHSTQWAHSLIMQKCYTFFFNLIMWETIMSRVCLIHSSYTSQPLLSSEVHSFIGIQQGPHLCIQNSVQWSRPFPNGLVLFQNTCDHFTSHFIQKSFINHSFIRRVLIAADNTTNVCKGFHHWEKPHWKTVVFVIDENTQNLWFLQLEKPLKISHIFIDKTHSKRKC